jgi:hypothetical protein
MVKAFGISSHTSSSQATSESSWPKIILRIVKAHPLGIPVLLFLALIENDGIFFDRL